MYSQFTAYLVFHAWFVLAQLIEKDSNALVVDDSTTVDLRWALIVLIFCYMPSRVTQIYKK